MSMDSIRVFTLNNIEEWHQVLELFPRADVYYYPEYTVSFAENGDGTPWCIYYESDTIRAINVVMVRPVPNPNHLPELDELQDFVTPYGYGGFLIQSKKNEAICVSSAEEDAICNEISDAEIQQLKTAYESFCREHSIVAEFVRFHPVLANAHEDEALYQVIDLGHTVCLDTSSKEIVWQNITSKNRNMIRKAEKNGVIIHQGNSEELFTEFEKIYNHTMDKVQASDYYYFPKAFYDSIREQLNNHATIFYAVKDDIIVAMSIIMYSGTSMHYHLSASRREYQTYAPTNLILYTAANWGCEQGMKTFHLGGGLGSHEDHLYHFKKEFNRGEDTLFSIGKKIYLPESYERICEEVNADEDTSFFPRYRA